jgi:hypothetical protein
MNEGLDEEIEIFPWNVRFVKKVSAVDEKIRFYLQRMLHDIEEVSVNPFRSSPAALFVVARPLEELKPEVRICRVDEFQMIVPFKLYGSKSFIPVNSLRYSSYHSRKKSNRRMLLHRDLEKSLVRLGWLDQEVPGG